MFTNRIGLSAGFSGSEGETVTKIPRGKSTLGDLGRGFRVEFSWCGCLIRPDVLPPGTSYLFNWARLRSREMELGREAWLLCTYSSSQSAAVVRNAEIQPR